MVVKRGVAAVVVYLVDFFICAPTMEECAAALNTLLLRKLGFRINWDKVVDPVLLS